MTYLEGYAAGLRAAVQDPSNAPAKLGYAEKLLGQGGQQTAVDTNVVDDGYGPREASR